MNRDEFYMKKAIDLAYQADGFTNPNPMVGCVIVKNDEIIATGYHERYGDYHAERNAINKLDYEQVRGSTVYVTLEPCNHHGKTLPCLELLLEMDVERVVIGTLDPNPIMNGKSVQILKEHHIKTTIGVLEEDCLKLIKEFSYFHVHHKPYVTVKLATSLDGQIATKTGQSQWITSQESRRFVHQQRKHYMAIMVGSNTIKKDDSLLTARIDNAKNPIRIVCDTNLSIDLDRKIVLTANEIPTYIATCNLDKNRQNQYIEKGVKIIECKKLGSYVDLHDLMNQLVDLNIISIYIEGGPTLVTNCLKQKVANHLEFYLAPILLGSSEKYSAIHDLNIEKLKDAIQLSDVQTKTINQDVLYEADIKYV